MLETLRNRRNSARKGKVQPSHQRLDIQGLRMVAVLVVFANHLFGWPRGGFVGVDVFFVISGFLITGNLLRTAETKGNVSFRRFYWNRVRRIVPAATVVLVLTYLASVLVLQPFRAHQVGVDALSAFVFMSNWWFAFRNTDYFAAGEAVSPIQHYWSLSIEEQFYFVWPALIFVIGLLVARRAWTHDDRMRMAGVVMTGIIALSLGWALFETASAPKWAYFDTFARVWELGVGALLATAVGRFARIPARFKPWLSWGGLGLIGASLFLITEGSVGFPAPWALLPVLGSAMVLAAGVGGEPEHQMFLRNEAAVYIGNISYSLYLVHWPVIVILGALAPRGVSFYLAVVAISFGLAIASYHFVENPLRYGDRAKARKAFAEVLNRRFHPQRSTRYASVAVLTLLTLGLTAFAVRPVAIHQAPESVTAQPSVGAPGSSVSKLGPLGSGLQQQIREALKATQWPQLDPSIESAMDALIAAPEIVRCGGTGSDLPTADTCSWGSPSAATRIVLVGDSIAESYAGPLRELAMNSGNQIQLHMEAMSGCMFINDDIRSDDQAVMDKCPARKQHAIEWINSTKPDIVIIADWYAPQRFIGSEQPMTRAEWADSMRKIVDKIRGSAKKVVWLSAPPADKNIKECYGTRQSVPADCIGQVTDLWSSMAEAEQGVAQSMGGVWIDSRPWFCSDEGLCPAFAGSTPTKRDLRHMSEAYGVKIAPVIEETLKAGGVL